MEKLEFAKQLVIDAGELIKTMMDQPIDVEKKTSKSDLVTNVDKATETFIVEGIQERFDHQTFLTEEKTVESKVGDHMWIIDPIDGTTNFIYQRENFSISVAYFYKEKPVFGIVYDVIKKDMYWAHIDLGAYLNDQRLEKLDQNQSLDSALLSGDVYRPGMFRLSPAELKPKFITHRFLGSGALETAQVGAGKFQSYVFPKIKIWDIAAGLIILNMSGGTWLFGDKHDTFYFDDCERMFIASSNNLIKNELITYL